MKTILFRMFFGILVLVNLTQISQAQDLNLEWVSRPTSTDGGIGYSVVTDKWGNTFTTGYFSDSADFDPGVGRHMGYPDNRHIVNSHLAIFIQKLDKNGNFLWVKTFGSGSGVIRAGYSMKVDDLGNAYVIGDFQGSISLGTSNPINLTSLGGGDVFILKLDPNGNYLWAKSIGSRSAGEETGVFITLDDDNNVYATGGFSQEMDFDPGPGVYNLGTPSAERMYLLKLNTDGDFVWVKVLEAVGLIRSITFDDNSNMYLTGGFGGSGDLDPGIGTNIHTSNGEYDIFIQKYDFNGNLVWSKTIGGPTSDAGRSLCLDKENEHLYLTGYFEDSAYFNPSTNSAKLVSDGNKDYFVLKLDTSSNFIWAKSFGNHIEDLGLGIDIDSDGNIYTTGCFTWTVDFDPSPAVFNLTATTSRDVFIHKLDSSGGFIWAKSFGVHYNDIGQAITLNDMGDLTLTGHIGGAVDFDPGPGVHTLPGGQIEIFTTKLKQRGVVGSVFYDFDQDCIQGNLEKGMIGRRLVIQPGNIIVETNISGNWNLDSLPIGAYTITIDTTNWISSCPITQSFSVLSNNSITNVADFGGLLPNNCSFPDVSIIAPFIRPGFGNQEIRVQVCNLNNSTNIIDSAVVVVELDPLQTIQSASLPYVSLGNNKYEFYVADTIYPGYCSSFQIMFQLSTNASIGQTICMSASFSPVDSCTLDTIPNAYPSGSTSPCTTPWDRSKLAIQGSCLNDSIRFVIYNRGLNTVGDMDCFAPVRLYIDAQLILMDSVNLDGGDSIVFMFSGDGRTWRMEVDQHPLHPGNSRPNASVELCGNSQNWTPNLVNFLAQDDADIIKDIYCGVVTGSYDPNDKTGFPLGVESTHDIIPGQELEYLIRFQNTGTDTAFTVIIRDTLSTDLDVFSIRSGLSSHNYSFRIYGPRILEWTFNGIMLPDSNVNEVASHGFVTFKVNQQEDLPIGTIIENSSAIYFDYNPPIITNTTIHTIDTTQLLNWSGIDTINHNVCGRNPINGFVYTNSGLYYQRITRAGNDSLYYINATVLDSYNEMYVTTCDSFLLNNQTYHNSGIYEQVYTNHLGCDSVIIIDLKLNNSDDIIDVVVCSTYTAPDGQVYTTSGQYVAIVPNSLGCDSSITINLLVQPSVSSTFSVSTCSNYTAPDGQTYTTSGQYVAVIPNSLGCDSIITIDLDIRTTTRDTISVIACYRYTSPSNQVLSFSGQYTSTLMNSYGCDSIITINLTIIQHTTSTINALACYSYTAPDSQIYTTTGQYTAIIPNQSGCDSTITINLTVSQTPTSETIHVLACSSYTAPDSQIYTTSGQYVAIIPNQSGCDSTITIHLSISQTPTSNTINELACTSYTAPDGQVYASSGQYTAILSNSYGCDSTITINLTIGTNDTTINVSNCTTSYMAPDNQVYTTSGQYVAIIPNQFGCDSTITINLTMNTSSSDSIGVNWCQDYPAPDGQILDSSGVYVITIPNQNGCDSFLTINLNLIPMDTTLNVAGTFIWSNATGATSQLLDCNNNYAVISPVGSGFYSITANGTYAIELTLNGCTDTTECATIVVTDNHQIQSTDNVDYKVYPNPTNSVLYIKQLVVETLEIQLSDNLGRLLLSKIENKAILKLDIQSLPSGVYYLTLNNGREIITKKVIKRE